MTGKLHGIIPPMTTPFNAEGEIDEKAFRAQVRFFLDKGVHGICVGGSTGEGHTLTRDEFRQLMAATVEEVGGKVPVVAGIIANSTREAILRARDIDDLNVDALQITPVHYLFKPSEEATYQHFRTLAESVKQPVIIYNVIPWNYLSPAQLIRIMREIPGVIGVKQSQGDMKLMADLLLDVPEGKLVFSAVDALLYPSFALGSPGTIAANPAAVPGVCVALWDAVQRGDHATAMEIHTRMLRFWNTIVGDNLPACVKYALELQGCPVGLPRAPMPVASEAQKAAIAPALRHVLEMEGQGVRIAAE
ncbi:dihydrodipicolinate synthase family protein [Roseomonas gilardii subsp. gilardii]|uniref:dihydrodipicolinate synthase family protein n=1 Tax=Roseomonas gilardii TaxID=257708 RepID=UPI001FF71574|nr:dihydrodipicolinate synthase family protein [Roseomonas gilardii]UPG73704.1 dihydrodipicolinate synthase family protein [Roseomonas gilardii subsp. gilardii]